jgi:thiamine-monophosphate kinase
MISRVRSPPSRRGLVMKRNVITGERRIIKTIQEQLDEMPDMPIPFGDDVSAYSLGNDRLAVLKTDMLVGRTDVPRTMTLRQAARKAVVMNISDFAAKGVKPLALMASLGLPRGLTERDVEHIGRGLNTGARQYGTYIIGGDTGEASDLIISVSVFGITEKTSIMLRSGARPGDIVAVTGSFGKTAAGLRILSKDQQKLGRTWKALIKSVLMPQARLREGLTLSKTGAVTASIDSSDGLAWSLHEIARASRVGFLIDKLPMAKEAKAFAEENKLEPAELALYGGEEYELILAVKPEGWQEARRAAARVNCNLIRIGKATAEKHVLLSMEGRTSRIKARGYEHFKS